MERTFNELKVIADRLKKEYPKGTRVKLIKMNDKYAPPVGMLGRVDHVDDIASIHVSWDNGSTLAVIYDEDICRKV